MSIIKPLKDKLKRTVYPRTVERAVYDDNGVRLDNKLNTKADEQELIDPGISTDGTYVYALTKESDSEPA